MTAVTAAATPTVTTSMAHLDYRAWKTEVGHQFGKLFKFLQLLIAILASKFHQQQRLRLTLDKMIYRRSE